MRPDNEFIEYFIVFLNNLYDNKKRPTALFIKNIEIRSIAYGGEIT